VVEGRDVRIVGDESGDEPEKWNPSRSKRIAVATVVVLVVAVLVSVQTLVSTGETTVTLPEALPATTTTPSTTTSSPTTSTSPTTTTVWRGVTYPATAIESDAQSLCEIVSGSGHDRLKTIEEWSDAVSQNVRGTSTSFSDRIALEAAYARNAGEAEDVELVGLLLSVSSDIEAVGSAVENAFRYNPDQDPDVYIFQMFLIERHCASAATTISVLVGNTATTTSVEHSAWELVNVIGPDIRTFCERASPVGADRIMAFDAWLESLNDDDWFLQHGDALEAIGTETGKVMDGLEVYRRVLLNAVQEDLRNADSALHDAVQAIEAGQADEWTYPVLRIERHCARAVATVSALKALSNCRACGWWRQPASQ
jgi:hypothetical protein